MRFRFKKVLFGVLVAFVVLIGGLIAKKSLFKDDLININELPQEFMDNYFEEVSESNSKEEKENMLIITSKSKLKDTYGATKIIEAPNNQYFLQYNSKEEKEAAFEKFNNENSSIDVSENNYYEFYEDTVLVSSYNSWGVEAMGMDTLLEKLENKELNDVTVGIIDSGLDVDLFNKYYPGRLAGVYNVLENNDNMYDNHGHGTHIAGTIAESTPSSVKILPVKISDSDGMYETDILTGINYIAYNENADVINMSFGGIRYSKEHYNAIEAAKRENIITVAAAGNNNSSEASYPAAFSNTLSISAVDSNNERAFFSNYGDGITFTAPGVDIKSILGKDSNIVKGNEKEGIIDGDDDHELMSGTSMATPHVVAAVANLKSLNKDLSFEDTITILRRYSDDLGDVGWDEYYGFGFINFDDAQICDGEDCDEYNVFKSSARDNLEEVFASCEVVPVLSEYNYGTITNILGTKVKINYTNGKSFEYQLSDIENLEMSDYDPLSKEPQAISIKFETPHGRKIERTFEVTNPQNYESIWEYELVGDNEIEITDFKADAVTGSELYFPSTIDGYTVTGIADRDNSMFGRWKWDSFKKVKYLYLPASITRIGNHAFGNKVEGVDSTYLESGLNVVKSDAESLYIGDNAFNTSHSLYEFDATVSYVGDEAFSGASSLKEIKFSDDITHIGNEAFRWAMLGKSITIPSTITEIGERAFAGDSIREIVFENDIETISNEMFWNSWNLEKVALPDSVKQIGENAFYHCTNLETINLPDGLTTIGNNAFEGAFKHDGDIGMTIPRSVKTIGEDAFKDIDSTAKLYVYSNSVAKSYAHDNNINYVQIDPDTISVQGINSQYHAFDKIDMNNVSVGLTYNEESVRTETITDNIEIVYPDSREDFRYGDTSVKVIAYNNAGYKIEKDVEIEVLKLDPSYEIPSGLQAYVGQKLSDVQLPDNFEWMDGNQNISEPGDKVFKAKFVPDDTANYSIVENIDITLSVSEKLSQPEITKYQVEDDIIKDIPLNTNVSDLDLGLSSNYTVKIKNKDNEEKEGIIGTGDKIEIYLSNNLVSNYYVSIKGDINGDGLLKLKDLLTVKNYILKFGDVRSEFDNTKFLFSAADYSGDGKISLKDFVQMKIDFLSH